MSIVLYRKGDTHTVRGIACELKIVSHEHFSGVPDAGWFLNVQDINKVGKTEEPQEIESNVIVVSEETKTIDGMDNDEIRVAAKMAGMRDYDTARIRTLKNKLKVK